MLKREADQLEAIWLFPVPRYNHCLQSGELIELFQVDFQLLQLNFSGRLIMVGKVMATTTTRD